MALQHLRSNTASKRPTPGSMSDGQLAINTNATSPGLFFKDAGGALIKVGPVHVGTSAPNSVPAGSSGNAIGEQWLDTSGGGYVLKIWDGSAWRSETGQFVDVAGDTMTGNLTISGADLIMSNGEIVAETGSAATPSITFTGDTNTGLYSPGADQVALSTNGTGRLFVDASGNVGFNTTPETSTGRTVLTFNGTSGDEIRLNTNGTQALALVAGTDAGILRASAATGYLRFDTGGATERLRITSAGLVGIGTSSPDAKLDIKGNSGTYPTQQILHSTFDTDGEWLRIGRTDTANIRYHSIHAKHSGTSTTGFNYIQFKVHDPNISTTGQNTVLHLDGLGRVGIGTTSPGVALHVDGDIRADGIYGETDTNTSIQFPGSDVITFNEGGSEAARIDSFGRLLVGTSSSITTSVAGQSYTGIREQLAGTDGNTSTKLIAQYSATTTFGPTLAFAKSKDSTLLGHTAVTNGTTIGRITAAGSNGTAFIEGARVEAIADANFATTSAPTRLVFSTTASGTSSPTEQLRITSDRYVRLASGTGGIQFNGDTAAANALDDYEEGTWTPIYAPATGSFGSVTYDPITYGKYAKIGNLVICEFALRTDALSVGTASGPARVGGLPFTASTTPAFSAGSVYLSLALGFGGDYPSSGAVSESTTLATLYFKTSANSGSISLDVSDLATGADSNYVLGTIVYMV